MHIVLLGYRTSGKTTTGRALATLLGCGFVDLDERLVAKFAMPIGQVFRLFGEPWFRAAECMELERALDEPAGVLALGGGTVCEPAAAERLTAARANGTAKAVYLRARVDTLQARLCGADLANRPALTGAEHPANEVPSVLEHREPLYRAASDVILDVDDVTAQQAAAEIVRVLGLRPT
jgi:shikimate kinase